MGLEFAQKPEQLEKTTEPPTWHKDVDFKGFGKLAQKGAQDAAKAAGDLPPLSLFDPSERDGSTAVAGKPEKDAPTGGEPKTGDVSGDSDSAMSGKKGNNNPEGIEPGTFEPKPEKVEQPGPF